jgi:hypothetical protein
MTNLVVATAASSNHHGALVQMLASLRRLDARVECYDLGLTAEECRELPAWDGATYRPFDYASYPSFMDVTVNAGEYAWKPVIVADVVDRARRETPAPDVLWADAGCFFDRIETAAERIADSGGLYVRRSAGTKRDWTHPGMFTYLGIDGERYGDLPNADATLVGFAIGSGPPERREAVYQEIVLPWKTCALVKECIAPHGSSRANHRQDQAVLSYLVHRGKYSFAMDTPRELGVRTKCDRWFYHYVGFGVPPAVYARTCLA